MGFTGKNEFDNHLGQFWPYWYCQKWHKIAPKYLFKLWWSAGKQIQSNWAQKDGGEEVEVVGQGKVLETDQKGDKE